MVLVWDAVVLHHRAALPEGPDSTVLTGGRPPELVVRLATLVPVLCVGLLAAGTVVTGTGPHGGDQEVERLPLEIEAVARTHGIVAVLFLLCVLALVLVARRTPGLTAVVRWSAALLWASVAQAALGYWQYFNGVPPLAVGVHVALATVVWALAVQVALSARSPVPAGGLAAATTTDAGADDEGEPEGEPELVGGPPPR
jgi:cytochrome c oxidase assembly protein subunit 15